jgi:hypothetical protein
MELCGYHFPDSRQEDFNEKIAYHSEFYPPEPKVSIEELSPGEFLSIQSIIHKIMSVGLDGRIFLKWDPGVGKSGASTGFAEFARMSKMSGNSFYSKFAGGFPSGIEKCVYISNSVEISKQVKEEIINAYSKEGYYQRTIKTEEEGITTSDKSISRNISTQLRDFYEFTSPNKFARQLREKYEALESQTTNEEETTKLYQTWLKQKFAHVMFILDEVHNIIPTDRQDILYAYEGIGVLGRSKLNTLKHMRDKDTWSLIDTHSRIYNAFRLIGTAVIMVLTATPIVNSAKPWQLAGVLNLVNAGDEERFIDITNDDWQEEVVDVVRGRMSHIGQITLPLEIEDRGIIELPAGRLEQLNWFLEWFNIDQFIKSVNIGQPIDHANRKFKALQNIAHGILPDGSTSNEDGKRFFKVTEYVAGSNKFKLGRIMRYGEKADWDWGPNQETAQGVLLDDYLKLTQREPDLRHYLEKLSERELFMAMKYLKLPSNIQVRSPKEISNDIRDEIIEYIVENQYHFLPEKMSALMGGFVSTRPPTTYDEITMRDLSSKIFYILHDQVKRKDELLRNERLNANGEVVDVTYGLGMFFINMVRVSGPGMYYIAQIMERNSIMPMRPFKETEKPTYQDGRYHRVNSQLLAKRLRFAMIVTADSGDNLQSFAFDLMKSPDNIHGEYLKCIIGTGSISTGISLRNMLDAYFITHRESPGQQKQAEGRIKRVNAFDDMMDYVDEKGGDPQQIKIRVHRVASVFSARVIATMLSDVSRYNERAASTSSKIGARVKVSRPLLGLNKANAYNTFVSMYKDAKERRNIKLIDFVREMMEYMTSYELDEYHNFIDNPTLNRLYAELDRGSFDCPFHRYIYGIDKSCRIVPKEDRYYNVHINAYGEDLKSYILSIILDELHEKHWISVEEIIDKIGKILGMEKKYVDYLLSDIISDRSVFNDNTHLVELNGIITSTANFRTVRNLVPTRMSTILTSTLVDTKRKGSVNDFRLVRSIDYKNILVGEELSDVMEIFYMFSDDTKAKLLEEMITPLLEKGYQLHELGEHLTTKTQRKLWRVWQQWFFHVPQQEPGSRKEVERFSVTNLSKDPDRLSQLAQLNIPNDTLINIVVAPDGKPRGYRNWYIQLFRGNGKVRIFRNGEWENADDHLSAAYQRLIQLRHIYKVSDYERRSRRGYLFEYLFSGRVGNSDRITTGVIKRVNIPAVDKELVDRDQRAYPTGRDVVGLDLRTQIDILSYLESPQMIPEEELNLPNNREIQDILINANNGERVFTMEKITSDELRTAATWFPHLFSNQYSTDESRKMRESFLYEQFQARDLFVTFVPSTA